MSTYKDLCTAIADHIAEQGGERIDPETIFNADPRGELWHIHDAYWMFRGRGMPPVDGFEPEPVPHLPPAPILGQIVTLTDGSVHVWLGQWHMMVPAGHVV